VLGWLDGDMTLKSFPVIRDVSINGSVYPAKSVVQLDPKADAKLIEVWTKQGKIGDPKDVSKDA
jgi:hypothetical protein